MLNITKENIEEWMKLALELNCKYVILTSRHHDGYCNWNTNTTTFKYNKFDILKIFQELAIKYKLLFGIYYSWFEFNTPITIKYFDNIIIPQIEELKKYNPDIWWFDGHWELKTKYVNDKVINICKELKKLNPQVQINDRISGKLKGVTSYNDLNYLGESTFRNYDDRTLLQETVNVPWESIQTIGLSWGRNKYQSKDDYKTAIELNEIWKQVKKYKGRLLINVGPNYDGSLDENEVKILKEFNKI